MTQTKLLPQKAAPTRRTLYALDSCPPETLLLLCRLLVLRGYSGDSTVYIAETDPLHGCARFCLALEETGNMPPLPEEFGTRIAASSMLLCLAEHGICLCAHNAVERLSDLYDGKAEPPK